MHRLSFSTTFSDDAKTETVGIESLSRLTGELTKSETEKLEAFLGRIQKNDDFTRLVAKFKAARYYDDLLDIATASQDPQTRVNAIQALLDLEQQALVTDHLIGWSASELERFTALLDTLSASQSTPAALLLAKFVANHTPSLESRRQTIRALGRMQKGSQVVLDWAKRKSYDRRLEPAIIAALYMSPSGPVKEQAHEIFPMSGDEATRQIPDIQALLKLRGDVARGRDVFNSEEAKCAKCHIVNGAGKSVGPELSEIGAKLAPEAAFESVLYPSAGIAHSFENWKVLTVDGETVNGLLVSRTDTEVQIKNSDGIVQTIASKDIDEMDTSTVSLMPDGLHQQLSDQQLADLVAYLTTLKKAH